VGNKKGECVMTLAEKVRERLQNKAEKRSAETSNQMKKEVEKIANSMTTPFKRISEKKFNRMSKYHKCQLIKAFQDEGFEVASERWKCGWLGKEKTFYRISVEKMRSSSN